MSQATLITLGGGILLFVIPTLTIHTAVCIQNLTILSFSHSRDMAAAPKILNRSHDSDQALFSGGLSSMG